MNFPLRLILCTVYLHSLVMTLNHIHPGWFEELVREVGRLADSRRERLDLQDRLEAINLSRQIKREVAMELVAHRLSLREAAARFQELNTLTGDARWWEIYRQRYPGQSDEERHCKEVILYVEAMVSDELPEQAAAVTSRLEAELQAQLEQERMTAGGG
jgi:hypothetical protein